jgi:hypothetical protein
VRKLLSWSMINKARFLCADADFTDGCPTGAAAAKYNESMAQSVYFMRILNATPHAGDAVK